jgi:hypothetical protein
LSSEGALFRIDWQGRSLVRVLTMLTQPREAPLRVTNMRNNN